MSRRIGLHAGMRTVLSAGFRRGRPQNKTMDDDLIQAAQAVAGRFRLSEPRLTAGQVGAALRTRSGQIYTGICLDLACGIGTCAEHSAIAEMLKHRETEVDSIVAISDSRILPPCGRCRELLVQIDAKNKGTVVILAGDKCLRLYELLPHYWIDAHRLRNFEQDA
jgi:cytidine deaminase